MDFKSATTSVSKLSYDNNQGKIDLNAPYQRGEVWTLEKKSFFIDSVIRTIPTPKISMRSLQDSIGHRKYEIADGKQRLTAIFEFLKDKIQLPQDAEPIEIFGRDFIVAGRVHSQLPHEVTEKFAESEITCDYIEASDEEIRDYFRRINNGKAMTSFEKRNSIPGSINNMITKICNHPIVMKINKNETKQKEFCEKSIFTLFNGIQDMDHKTMKSFHEKNKDILIDKYVEKMNEVFNLFYNIFGKSTNRTFKKSTSSISIFKMLHEYGNIFVDTDEVLKWYIDNEQGWDGDVEYAKSTRGATNSQHSIEYVYNKLHDSLEQCIKSGEIILKDKRRFFSATQKASLYAKAKGLCQMCNKKLHNDPYHADHIYAHAKGGSTTIDNGQLLCIDCNLKKSDD